MVRIRSQMLYTYSGYFTRPRAFTLPHRVNRNVSRELESGVSATLVISLLYKLQAMQLTLKFAFE